ncbi:MAG: SRPBCC family protein [Acidimicrobiia bacterium]
MRIEESIVINRPSEEVFAFFLDRRNDKRWMETVESSEWTDGEGPVALGKRGRIVMHTPRRTEFDDEVTEYEPGRRVGHRMVSDSMIMFTACYADPISDGTRATVVFEPERLPGGSFGKLVAPLVARTVRRNYRADLARLKRILESEDETDT